MGIIVRDSTSEYEPTNRQQAQTKPERKSWCWGCDMSMVGEGQRCRNCGYRYNHKVKRPIRNAKSV